MIRRLFAVISAAIISVTLLAVPVSAAKSVIDDMAGLYSEKELKELNKTQQEIADLTGWNIAVVTSSVGLGEDGKNAMRFAEDYYDNTFGSDSSSVVYLIDLDYRHFAMDGTVLDYFNSSRLDKMIKDCEKKYFAYDDVGNLESFYYHLKKNYNAGTVSRDADIGKKGDGFVPADGISGSYDVTMLIGGMFAGIIAAIIGIAIVLGRYKMHHAPTANCYLNGNNINFYNRTDRFVREYTTRTRIDTDSGGGGGGHGGGGISHGGSHHGGGGHGGRR